MRDGEHLPETEEILQLRQRLWANSYRPIAVYSWDNGGKAPIGRQWQLRCQQDPPEATVLPAVEAALNTGIYCAGLRAIDLDIDDAKLVERILTLATEHLGGTIVRIRENSPRCLLLYRASGEPSKRAITGAKHSTDRSCRIEVLGKGSQFVAYGMHQTKVPLLWKDGRGPEQLLLTELPVVTENQVTVFLLEAGLLLGVKELVQQDGPHISGQAEADPLLIARAMTDIPNVAPPDWEYWNKIGMAIWRATAGSEAGWSLFNTWSAKNAAYNPDSTRKRWDNYTNSPPTRIGAGTLFWLAWQARQAAGAPEMAKVPLPDDEPAPERDRYLDPQAPIETARLIIHKHQVAGADLLSHQGVVHRFSGTHYVAQDDEAMRQALYKELERLKRVDPNGTVQPYGTTRQRVADVLSAIRAVTNVTGDLPQWTGEPPFAPEEALITTSGVLHIPSRTLHPHSPTLLCTNALPYGFDPTAPEPSEWLKFLNQLWPHNTDEIGTLQEFFGLSLTPVTRFQKLFMLVGPFRSGKGTILRVLTALVGAANVCNPTLAALSERFGLQPLIGKRLAIIADARLSGRTDKAAVVERLLNLSGEDAQTIDRKHIGAWTGHLETRCLIATNELPKFTDASGAIATRFIYLTLKRSFLGQENVRLTDNLLEELPGILNWALDGWRRLSDRGHFVMPAGSEAVAQRNADLTSPVRSFVRQLCIVTEPDAAVPKAVLFERWCRWCQDEGLRQTSNVVFGRDMFAAFPTIGETRLRQTVNGEQERIQHYTGIRLANPSELDS